MNSKTNKKQITQTTNNKVCPGEEKKLKKKLILCPDDIAGGGANTNFAICAALLKNKQKTPTQDSPNTCPTDVLKVKIPQGNLKTY